MGFFREVVCNFMSNFCIAVFQDVDGDVVFANVIFG